MARVLGTIFAILAGVAFGRLLRIGFARWRPTKNPRNSVWRFPLVELAVGGTWGVLAWRLMRLLVADDTRLGFALPGFNLEYTAGFMVLCTALIAIAMLDGDRFPLSDFVTLPGVAIGVLFYALTTEQMIRLFIAEAAPWREIGLRLLSVICAGGLVLLIRWTYWLLRRREILGWGEAHLMAMLAAWLGLPQALLAFSIGVLIGTVFLILLWAAPVLLRHSKIWASPKLSVGALVCAGGVVSCLWGTQILSAYLRWSALPKLALNIP
jgi:leader peptidase (prepilin peptidase)/N-methyltransferase